MKNIFRVFGFTAALFFLAVGAANAAQPGMRCVQNQLNALGFDAGEADGAVGGRTIAAANAYNDWVKVKDPGSVLPPLNKTNGQFWCDQIASANPEVAKFNVDDTPKTLVIVFNGNVPGSFNIRVGTERVNSPECQNGPCIIDPMAPKTLRADANGVATLSVAIKPEATRACVQMASSSSVIDVSELYMTTGGKKPSNKGGDLEANGMSSCSSSNADAKKAVAWVLTLK